MASIYSSSNQSIYNDDGDDTAERPIHRWIHASLGGSVNNFLIPYAKPTATSLKQTCELWPELCNIHMSVLFFRYPERKSSNDPMRYDSLSLPPRAELLFFCICPVPRQQRVPAVLSDVNLETYSRSSPAFALPLFRFRFPLH